MIQEHEARRPVPPACSQLSGPRTPANPSLGRRPGRLRSRCARHSAPFRSRRGSTKHPVHPRDCPHRVSTVGALLQAGMSTWPRPHPAPVTPEVLVAVHDPRHSDLHHCLLYLCSVGSHHTSSTHYLCPNAPGHTLWWTSSRGSHPPKGRVILTIVDPFSRSAHFAPLQKLPSAAEIGKLMAQVSDRCPQFTSWVWQSLCAALGVTVSLSSGHHLQFNGQTEWAN